MTDSAHRRNGPRAHTAVHEPLVAQVRRTIDRYGMVLPGERVLVALSGGPDSVALLAALATLAPAYGIEVVAAHFNHQLRGDEAVRDQRCAEEVARRLCVAYVVGAPERPAGPANIEAAAREQRYAFLAATAAARGCSRIATGHTRNDQAETVLMRLLRGAGSDGLQGIRAVRERHIIRPLLHCSREQVLAFLRVRGLPVCQDSSNADRRFLRNRVRHEIMPLLRAINKRVDANLASAAEILCEESALLEERARACVEPALASNGGMAVTAIADAPSALRGRIVRMWLHTQRGTLRRLTATHIRQIVALACGARPSGRVDLPGMQAVVREYAYVRFRADRETALPAAEHKLAPGTVVGLEPGWQISAEIVPVPGEGAWKPPDLWSFLADADAVVLPLTVRRVRPGDRVQALGVGGHRKLQDIFVDRKVPVTLRRAMPVVECDGQVIWVPGVVRSDTALVTAETAFALRLVARGLGIAAAECLC